MRSVTCSRVSSTVAPGQRVWITMVLMVKDGSSSRPSSKYDQVPISKVTNIRYQTRVRCLSAQSERLNPFIVLPRRG
ncbi:hypothetical protein FQZ97_790760 [compost metagenome]